MKTTRRRGSHQGRRQWGRAQQVPREDPYELAGKPPEPAFCPQCGASFHEGRWQWRSAPSGASLASHKAEILSLVRHKEEAEKGDHPLNRIIGIDEQDGAIVITTTDIHLPRRIGEALKRAFRGRLELHYEEDGYFLRATWRGDGPAK